MRWSWRLPNDSPGGRRTSFYGKAEAELDLKNAITSPFSNINLKWVLTVLVTVLVATGAGFMIGMWLGS